MGGQPDSMWPSETLTAGGASRPRCPGCPVEDCPVDAGAGEPLVAGWRLGLISVGLFLGPVVLAIVGAASLGESPGGQLAGAIGGLGLGLAGSVGAGRMLGRGGKIAGRELRIRGC